MLPTLLLGVFAAAAPAFALAAGPKFEVSFSKKLREEPFSGRVILFLSTNPKVEPRRNRNWLTRDPVFAQDVGHWPPDTKLVLEKLEGFPIAPADLPSGRYAVQAVMHTNLDGPHGGETPGDLCSAVKTIEVAAGKPAAVSLVIDYRIPAKPPPIVLDTIKPVRFKSDRLSRFHHRDVYLRAAVMLPDDYDAHEKKRYPALYIVPGFGGDEYESLGYVGMLGRPADVVCIGLDATCPLGHHVFADSANNGPCGRALVEELIPHLEKEFRLVPQPWARFLAGHSSGGWSSLWLQISHPDFFGGVWSTSPDPVDFHDFSGINIYDPRENFYRNAAGEPRPIMRMAGKVLMTLEDFDHLSEVIGPGGQMASFEAVFSPRGEDGRPLPLWDRKTGAIDPRVVDAWRRYDIADKLKREWGEIGPKLAGKITVIVGAQDNFYLAGAVRRLKKALKTLGSDAKVKIIKDRDHSSILFSRTAGKIMGEIQQRAARGLHQHEPHR